MGDLSNRQRILTLMDIFKRETDENNYLALDDIYEKMVQRIGPEFNVNMKSIKSDIDSISNFGLNIDYEIGHHNKKLYYYQDREFELYELRMLIDAVSSARFITSEESARLITKLKNQTSKYLAENLDNQIFLENKVKCENSSVRFFIDRIHSAIGRNSKIKFRYGSYNVQKEFNLHKNGDYYKLMPYALVWNSDFYYIIGIHEGKDGFSHYRIDRMRDVEIVDEIFQKAEFDVSAYLNRTFNMYSGDVQEIKLSFDKKLINVVLDKFGKDVNIDSISENTFNIKINAAISDGLVRWILTWGSDVEVMSPKTLSNKVKEEIQKMNLKYK